MKILWISPIVSHPASNLDRLMIARLGSLLMAHGHEVTFICSSFSPISTENLGLMSSFWTNFFYVAAKQDKSSLPYDDIQSAAKFFVADKPDLVICDYCFMTPYFSLFSSDIPKILIPHCKFKHSSLDYQTYHQQEWIGTLKRFEFNSYINASDILLVSGKREYNFVCSLANSPVLKFPLFVNDNNFEPEYEEFQPLQDTGFYELLMQTIENKRKRVLFVCDWPFWDTQYAFRSRVLPIIMYLQNKYKIHLFYFGKPSENDHNELQALGLDMITKFSNGEPNYHVDFSLACKSEFFDDLKSYLEVEPRFDAVILEYFYLSPLLEAFSYPLLKILDTHDLMSMRLYSSHENSTFQITAQMEKEIFNKFDAAMIIAKEEINFFSSLECDSIPIYCPLAQKVQPQPFPKRGIHFGFVGSGWILNTEAIQWFIDQVWPLQDRADAVLHIFGTVSNLLDEMPANVILHGVVDSFAEICGYCNVMLSPMLRGSGFPTKSLHSLAYGRPLIATRVGARGLAKRSSKGILVARDRTEFIEHMLRISHDTAYFNQLAIEAIQHVRDEFLACSSFGELDRLIEFY